MAELTGAESQEVERLSALYEGDERSLVSLLSGQLAVLKTQSQMLLGLCGLCITVTGFSGHNMVNAGPVGAFSMVIGIGLILVAVVVTLRAMVGIRWVTQDLGADARAVLEAVVPRRNQQQRAISLAGGCAAVGLSFYVVSVIYAALTHSSWTPP
jgi:hypothetical protein